MSTPYVTTWRPNQISKHYISRTKSVIDHGANPKGINTSYHMLFGTRGNQWTFFVIFTNNPKSLVIDLTFCVSLTPETYIG